MPVPTLTYEKKISALKEARKIRKKRAQIKKRLKEANINLKELLDTKNKDFLIASEMRIFDLLRALPGFGDVKTRKTMIQLQISLRKRFKGIGQKQKTRFLDFLNRL